MSKNLNNVMFRGRYTVKCFGPDGKLKWSDEIENLVVNEGLDHILDSTLAGGSQVTTWYVGLLAASPTPLATWTKTEVGANDFVDYDEATLVTWTPDAVSGQSVDNSTTPADFSINQDSSSVGGAYLASTNTKAVEGGAAVIFSAGAFTGGNKAVDNGDTLQVTMTFSNSSS